VNLTGRGRTSRDMTKPQLGLRTHLEMCERNLCDPDAAATLDGIAQGSISQCVLPWIPLLTGGGEVAIIERWKRLAETEPDSRLRSVYAALALVFAEATDCRLTWQRSLEGWNVKEPQIVLDWINEGRVEGEIKGKAEALLRVLGRRFPPVPQDLESKVRLATDSGQLDRWLDAAVTAVSLDEFRRLAAL
jgi:hypothetical protein